jgi:hypothetical protein
MAAQHPATEHSVAGAGEERLDEVGNRPRIVLMIGMDHHADVGAARERLAIAGLLVAAVAAAGRMDQRVEAEPPRHVDRPVTAGVVDQHHVVDPARRQIAHGPLEGAIGVERRHDHADPLRPGRGRPSHGASVLLAEHADRSRRRGAGLRRDRRRTRIAASYFLLHGGVTLLLRA